VTRALLAAGLAAVLAPVAAAVRAAHRSQQPSGAPGFSVEEIYRGRRVRVTPSATSSPSATSAGSAGSAGSVGSAGSAGSAGSVAAGGEAWHVTVDGRPLHLMRRADGTWLSMVDHYCSYPTPLAAARGAVDALGPHNLAADNGSSGSGSGNRSGDNGSHGAGGSHGDGGMRMRMGGHRGGVHA
jgi:hypothetical protein